jgi:hypothetical protein
VLLGSVLLLSPAARAQDASVADAAQADASTGDASVPCGDVDSLGQCQGTLLRVCSNGALAQTNCVTAFGPGFTCELTQPLLAAQCVFVADDAGVPEDGDAGSADAAVSTNPTTSDSGCGCLKPAWGQGAVWMTGLLVLRPRRRR